MRKAALFHVCLAGLLLLSALLSACGGTLEIDPRDLLTSEVSGVWVSTAAVGELGLLELRLERRELSRVYDALLASQSGPGLGASEGFGTLADGHLILDFGTGDPGEFYYEAQIRDNGTVITGVDGQFVFPGQRETLPVQFSYAGPLPADPQD